MENLVVALKRFSAGVIAVQRLTPPVKIELLDLGMNPILEMEASKIEQGLMLFSKERAAGATLAQPHPWSVRFTVEGKQPFVMDFPFPQS
jgi:hypothetical protein